MSFSNCMPRIWILRCDMADGRNLAWDPSVLHAPKNTFKCLVLIFGTFQERHDKAQLLLILSSTAMPSLRLLWMPCCCTFKFYIASKFCQLSTLRHQSRTALKTSTQPPEAPHGSVSPVTWNSSSVWCLVGIFESKADWTKIGATVEDQLQIRYIPEN